MRVVANIVLRGTLLHAWQILAIHACAYILCHAFTRIFQKITFDWGGLKAKWRVFSCYLI